jgi:hypothetical protein
MALLSFDPHYPASQRAASVQASGASDSDKPVKVHSSLTFFCQKSPGVIEPATVGRQRADPTARSNKLLKSGRLTGNGFVLREYI